jgi:hypothetical protein
LPVFWADKTGFVKNTAYNFKPNARSAVADAWCRRSDIKHQIGGFARFSRSSFPSRLAGTRRDKINRPTLNAG